MDARKVPFEYCYRWILCSIEISKRHYSLFLGCGLLLLFSTMAVSFIPFLGTIVVPLMTFMYGYGILRLSQQVMKTGGGTFDDFLKYTFDQAIFQKFTPLIVIIVVMHSVTVGLTIGNLNVVILPWSTLSNILTGLCAQAAFMMTLKTDLRWEDALKNIFRGSWLNVGALLCFGLCTILFVLGSLLMCIIGFFLYFIPMTMPVNYLVFSSIYENLDIDQTIKEWSSKSQEVQTLPAPADEP